MDCGAEFEGRFVGNVRASPFLGKASKLAVAAVAAMAGFVSGLMSRSLNPGNDVIVEIVTVEGLDDSDRRGLFGVG